MTVDRKTLGSRFAGIREDWLALNSEDILEPDLPIIDPHHHLWDFPEHRYLLSDLLADTDTGHNICATVYVDCTSYYRADGPSELRTTGEVEFANGIAAVAASGRYGPTRACAGIVSYADLRLGEAVEQVLAAHVAAGNGRYRGIRHVANWDASTEVHNGHTSPVDGLFGDATFRQGFAKLKQFGLSFEAWLYHPQLADVISLARDFPEQPIVLNHVGGVLGIGPYAGRRDEIFAEWHLRICELATCPNVSVKLGGLGMKTCGFGFENLERPASSQDLATHWRPYIEACIEAFGPARCMFESNFPVDKHSCAYPVLWNAFKIIAAGTSVSEKGDLFYGSAARFYRLVDLPPD
jgi:L-fuconolactonase